MQSPYVRYIKDELTDAAIYDRLAAREKHPENRALLERLAEQERGHAEFWRGLAPGIEVRPNRFLMRAILAMRAFFGVTFTVKFLELHEEHVIDEYRAIQKTLSPAYAAELEVIIADEVSHEKAFMAQLKEKRVAYMGFIALGLADAIVEITGVHAGFLGITGSTLFAGVSGITVGFAAAISMGSAAYIQAKQDPEKSPFTSGLATGLSYLFSVVLLAFPYFLTHVMFTAFVSSTLVGIALIGGLTFYSAVVFDRKFFREFGESVGLMLATAIATFFFGNIAGSVFHVGVGKGA